MVEVGRDPAVVLDAGGDGSRASSVTLYAPMTCFLRCMNNRVCTTPGRTAGCLQSVASSAQKNPAEVAYGMGLTTHVLAVAIGAAGAAYAIIELRKREEKESRLRRHLKWVQEAGFATLREELEVAVELAVQCGEAMLAACDPVNGADREAVFKGPSTAAQGSIDPQTATDLANERLVMETLSKRFPSHGLIGEETTAALGKMPEIDPSTPTWIVDPIDGTQNFCHTMPESAVSIGLCVAGKPELGVIFDPYRDELYVGIASERAAYLNGARLPTANSTLAGADASASAAAVSAVADAGSVSRKPRLDKAMVVTDVGYERSAMGAKRLAACHEALLTANTFGVRILGSTVLALAFLASGRCSAVYMGVGLKDCPKAWDWCAAHAIGTAVGVCFLRLEKKAPAFDLTSKSVCAARSPELAAELQDVLSTALAGWAPMSDKSDLNRDIWGLE